MINDTYTIKKGAQGGILRFVFGIFLLSVVFLGVFCYNGVEIAKSANVYIDNIEFNKKLDDLFIQFSVKTTFRNTNPAMIRFYKDDTNYFVGSLANPQYISPEVECLEGAVSPPYDLCYFEAGNTYTLNTKAFVKDGTSSYVSLANYINWLTEAPNTEHFLRFYYTPVSDSEKYYFTETPEVSVSYPFDNAEIAEAFDIIGTYNALDLEKYNILLAELYYKDLGKMYFFQQALETTTGNIDLRISGVPAGDYELGFSFYKAGFGGDYYITDTEIPISIVSAIPFELPDTQEQPPEFFSPISPEYIYQEYSNYATSTVLFDTLTGALKPIITTLGDNMVFFTAQFEQDRAKETGQNIGGAIIVVRTYASNINAFFNDLPVSEVLFFYLILLVVVAIFRIIRQAIGLIPFT